ncbi:MAG TPA: M43 family zinc metalloprotease [Chitinophagales bacterium]|nr:M43 family zinc metalloprotease [Chitinophagales bacterium]
MKLPVWGIAVMSVFCIFSKHAAAQIQRCHTMEYLDELKKKDPQILQKIEKARNAAARFLSSRPSGKRIAQALITIPVVVHVMHTGEAVGTGANISDEQIYSQIEVLNEDYQALNGDLSNVPSHFSGIIGNPQLEFCLAQFDPEGNPTTGIDRVDMGASGFWSDNLKPGTTWDASQYLNIWVTEIGSGTLGYTTFPGTSPDYDGVVIDYRYFGKAPYNPFSSEFNLGRTATHEIGHWLGLDHTFLGGCSGTSASTCSSGGDRICDTPPTASANYGCSFSTNRNTCTETPVDLPDMWMNFLDYMDDACLYMFSQGQVDMMLAVLNTSRASILTSIACGSQNLFSYSGRVVDARTGEGVDNAKVLFSGVSSYEIETDENGDFSSLNFRTGTYSVYAGKWGYMTTEFSTNSLIDSTTASIIIPIERGYYYDDFILDYGWAASGSATSGLWERGFPAGTSYNGNASNPDEDLADDFGEKCYVTGNRGGSAGNDDVDDGDAVLISPLFDLTAYNDPYISYYRWFFNSGGQGNPDDALTISISNGTHTQVIETLDAATPNPNAWNFKNIRVKDYILPTATMLFILETSDQSATGHLVEAALDGFSVFDSMPDVSSAPALADETGLICYPNPASALLNVSVEVPAKSDEPLRLLLLDATGKIIISDAIHAGESELKIDVSRQPEGVYFLKLLSRQRPIIRKVTVIR